MSLERYQEMRDFGKTPEPRGGVTKQAGTLRYFIQRHAASRLHYDFRLELDGVLKSWAVPKGPSLDPGERRLAVHVEDHPMEYGTFEGVIPQGSYGAGAVRLWDRGRWTPLEDPHRGYAKGHLKFQLEGEKLHGAWNLVRLPDEKNWLLIKVRDDAARDAGDVTEDRPESVARPEALPDVTLQLCTLVDAAPAGPDWIHEVKLDGYRVLAVVAAGRTRLVTRGGKDWTDRWPRIAAAVAALGHDELVLDGEIVVLDEGGLSDFGALAERLGQGRDTGMVFYAFDLLRHGRTELRSKPLLDRKRRLEKLLANAEGPVRHLGHVEEDGPAFFAQACEVGLEGIVSKRAGAPYTPGRGPDWLKVKCGRREELLIIGWTDPGGSRSGFGALLLATRKEGELVYAGRVGTGFDEALLASLKARFGTLGRDAPAVPVPRAEARGAHWIEPRLVAEVAYRGWTRGGRLRHPVFKGLRGDKPPEEVVVEEPVPVGEAVADARGEHRRGAAGVGPARPKRRGAPAAGASPRLTHPDRVVDPASGHTKGEVFAYVDAVADLILADIADRPLSLVRCPDGTAKACFYQKHVAAGFPASIHRIPVEEDDGVADYVSVSDRAGLLALVQFGVLEFHPWGSRADRLDRPDRVIFDLDPDPTLSWSAIVEGAERLREILDALGLRSFARVTGGKGVHLVAPIERRYEWDLVKGFTRAVADALVAESPDRYTATLAKAKRTGKTFVDYLRNGRGATAVCSWSTRARPGLPVAVPVTWEELRGLGRADSFGIAEATERAKGPDPWDGYAGLKQRLPKEVGG